MALKKIEFKNYEEPGLSAENLNLLQENIDEAIDKNGSGLMTGAVVAFEGNEIPEGFEEVPNPYMTKLYTGTSFQSEVELTESIDNFLGVLLVSHFNTYNVRASVFFPSEIAIHTNIPVKVYDNTSPSSARGVNVIITANGKTLQITQFDNASYLMSVYGIFRK